MNDAPRRPPILAAACLYLGVLAAIQSVRAITLVSTWNGDNAADRVAPQLDALRDAGMTQASAESAYKVFLTVLAVLAAAGVVFAIYTARGDRVSRIGLTVSMTFVGVFYFLGATGGSFFDAIIGALAIAFTARVWMGESGLWFKQLRGDAPVVPVQAPRRADPFAQPPASSVQEPVEPVGPVEPVEGVRTSPTPPPPPMPPPAWGQQQPNQHQWGQQHVHPSQPAPDGRPPKPVRIAGWTTLASAGLVAGVSALGLFMLGVLGLDGYRDMIRDNPMTRDMLSGVDADVDQVYRMSLTVFGVCLVLSLGGLIASWRVLAGKRSADVFLFVMAVVTAVVSALMFPVGLPWTALAVVVIVQLRRPEAKQWFTRS